MLQDSQKPPLDIDNNKESRRWSQPTFSVLDQDPEYKKNYSYEKGTGGPGS